MTKLLILAIVLLIVGYGSMPRHSCRAMAHQPQKDRGPGVEFALAWNTWVEMRVSRGPHELNLAEVEQWRRTQRAFRRVETLVEKEYGGR